MFWAFIILTHPSVLQELDFIFCTRGRGSWYFRLTGGLANFTPIAGMGHLISKPKFKASSTRIRKFVKTQIFFYEYGLRPHVSSVFSGRIRKFLKTLSRLEIFFIRYDYGDQCFAHRILGLPGGKHCGLLQRNVWRGVVSPLKAVSLDRECRILPWFYEKWRWLMLVHWNFSDIRWKQVIGSRLKIASLSGITVIANTISQLMCT